MDAQRRFFERPGKALFVRKIHRVVAVHRLGHVSRDRRDRQPTGLFPIDTSTDAVSDHGEEREALGVRRQELRHREAREMHLHPLLERGNEKVILVLAPHLAGVGEAKDVNLIVARLAT
jgi:hypothetical protein